MKEINTEMLTTFGGRIRTIRELLKMSQSQFASLFGRRQGVVSQWEIGNTPFPEEFIEILLKDKDVAENFLRNGEGQPFNHPLVISEPEAKYHSKIIYTQELMVARYSDAVTEYLAFKHLPLKEFADMIGANYTHLCTIVGKKKPPTIEILYKSYKAISLNPNYVILGMLPKFLEL